MHKILVLGAGLVARPLVRYLLETAGFHVTVASRTVSKAQKLIEKHPQGEAIALDTQDEARLEELIKSSEVAVSLLPATMHVKVAELCIRHRKNMVTTSYVSPEMRALDQAAKESEVTILNELGVDPGIDHMSAMRVIDAVRRKGGTVTSFRSYCGGLPAPEANDNPLGYKLSWSPRAVLVAARNSALYREKGKEVRIDGEELFARPDHLEVEGLGAFEAYPNRDSLAYIDLYGLHGVSTMYRGTLRNLGHCETWKKMSDLGLFSGVQHAEFAGLTHAEFMGKLAGTEASLEAVAKALDLEPDSSPMQKLEWLGLFSTERLPEGTTAAIDVLAAQMLEKCAYGEGERDMICLVHKFEADYPDGGREAISSTLVDFGIPGGDSSMSRTVSLPAAIATRLVAEGVLRKPGVYIPVDTRIYTPILNELASLGIDCKEERTAIVSSS